jgi:hypothetical protein
MDICEIGLLKDRNNRIKLYGFIKEDIAGLKKFMVSWIKLSAIIIIWVAMIISLSLAFEYFLVYAVNLIFKIGYVNSAYAILPFTVIVIVMLSVVLYKSLNYFDKLKSQK